MTMFVVDFCYLNDTNHVDKDMLLTQHLVCICISDDHENVLMIRMVTRKTNTYMGYPFKNLKSLSFHFLNQIKCNWFYNLKRLKSKSLSICYSKSHNIFFDGNWLKHNRPIYILWYTNNKNETWCTVLT